MAAKQPRTLEEVDVDLAKLEKLVKKLAKKVSAPQGAAGVNTVRKVRMRVRGKVVTRLVAGPSPDEAKPRGSAASKIIRSRDR